MKTNTEETEKIVLQDTSKNTEEVYWLQCCPENFLETDDKIKVFNHDDIVSSKLNPVHLNRLIRRKLGKTTSKLEDAGELNVISQLHEKVKNTFKNVFLKSYEQIMVSVALEIGMRDGRSKFCYRDIGKHVL